MKTRVLVILICWGGQLFAQGKKENAEALNKFMHVCRSYQQAPMHAQISIQTTFNLPAAGTDTAAHDADFYLLKDAAYIRFGNLEEVVSDSQALVISHDIRRMVIYTDAKPMIDNMRSSMTFGLDRKRLDQLARTCQAIQSPTVDGKASIHLASVKTVSGTGLATDSIMLEYNATTDEPYRIMQWSRSLLSIDSSSYYSLLKQPNWKGKTVKTDGGYFLVREQMTHFLYRQIEHGASVVMPAHIADRVNRNSSGDYEPVAAYTNYLLTQN